MSGDYKVVVVILLGCIVASLGKALFHAGSGPAQSSQMVQCPVLAHRSVGGALRPPDGRRPSAPDFSARRSLEVSIMLAAKRRAAGETVRTARA